MGIENILSYILKFLETILAWPVAVLILGITIIVVFKKPISKFISESTRGLIKTPFGSIHFGKDSALAQEELKKEISETREDTLRQKIQNNPDPLIEEYIRLNISIQFEKIYNVIFGTQLELLEHLLIKKLDGSKGDNIKNLRIYYARHIKYGGDSNYIIDNYFKFLISQNLIILKPEISKDDIFEISDRGVDFLNYLKSEYKSYKFKPL